LQVVFGVFLVVMVVLPFWIFHKTIIPDNGKGGHEWDFKKFASSFECQPQMPTWCDTYYEDTADVQQYLYNLQHPKNCSSARFLVLPQEYFSGFGSSIRMKAAFMGIAVQENRTFILPDGAEWIFGHACDPPSAECYFEPLTQCSTSLHAPKWMDAPKLTKIGEHSNERVVRLQVNYVMDPPEGFSRLKFVPRPFSNKDRFWWHAQAIKYVARPNERSRKIVAEEQKKIFPPDGVIPHPIISMYVRHGDKWKEATLHNLSMYMNGIEEVSQKHNIKDIYLNTDDPEVITEAKTSPRWARYKFHFMEWDRKNEPPLDFVRQNNGEDIMRVSIADLFIQIQGDVFSGTRSSNWCRMIDELRKTGGKARIPYFSPETAETGFLAP